MKIYFQECTYNCLNKYLWFCLFSFKSTYTGEFDNKDRAQVFTLVFYVVLIRFKDRFQNLGRRTE